MKKLILNKFGLLMIAAASLAGLNACSPEDAGAGNGLTEDNVDATFILTPIDGQANKFHLEATGKNVTGNKWSTGGNAALGRFSEDIFLPDAGTYTITHVAPG